jgi:heme/copper-type cytochrome/quinol oxidase subunit 3
MKNTKHQTPNIKEKPRVKHRSSTAGLKFGIWKFLGVWALVFGVLPSAFACATCYGASDSPLAQGMNWGIFTLLGFIGAVLFGIVVFFIHMVRNAARLERASQTQSQ